MKFIFSSIPRKFLTAFYKGREIYTITWKSYTVLSCSNVYPSLKLLSGPKSAAIYSYGFSELNHRFSSSQPVKISTLVKPIKTITPGILELLFANIVSLYVFYKVDRNFRVPEFKKGASQAINFITTNLVNGNVSALDELTTTSCLDNLIKSTETLSEEEKKSILIDSNSYSLNKILCIRFEYPKNGSAQLLLLKILFTKMVFNNSFLNGNQIEIQQHLVEFKRLYGEGINSHWIVSDMGIYLQLL